MKTQRLLFSVLLFCGMAAFATVLARPDSSDHATQQTESKFDPDEVKVMIGAIGLESGSVDVQITMDNGKTYFFTGSLGLIGEFVLDGDSFDVELFFHNTSPAFSRLTTSATLEFTQVSNTKYHVTVFDKRLTFGEIGLHFGNF